MNLGRAWKVLRKDLALGPRSPVFLYALILPVVMTAIVQFAFGSLFEPQPRLGIVDKDTSQITAELQKTEGISVTLLDDADELKTQVEGNDLDAGLVLPERFDAAMKSGEQPPLEFFIGGESRAENRIILTVTTMDLLRAVEGQTPPVEVKVVALGEKGLPISVRLVPLVVFYALVVAGIFLPGSSLVEEKEQGTLAALLVTPLKIGDVLAAKWTLGVALSVVMAMVTLVLNQALGGNWLDVFVVVLVAGTLSATIGLLIGVVSKDSTVLFGIVKGVGIFLFAPVVFYIFPDWPQWIAKLFPLYWVIEPIWQVSIMGERIGAVGFELMVAVAITVGLLVVTALLTRRMHSQMAAG